MRRHARLLPAALVALATVVPLFAACENGVFIFQRAQPDVVIRDSAGVTIVVNNAPEWGRNEGWVVAPEPVVSIGSVDGPEPQRLGRVNGAVRMEDGGVVVADAMLPALRFYGPDGRHRRDAGREGEGPGEFRDISGLQRIGASLVVMDFVNGRLSVFDTTGGFIDARTIEFAGSALGYLADGALVVEAMDAGGALAGPGETGRMDMKSALLLHPPGGGPPDTLGVFPGIELFRQIVDMGGTDRPMAQLVHFGRQPQAAVAGDRVYFGDRHLPIRILRPGHPTRLVHWGGPPRPATTRDVENLVDHSLRDEDDPNRRAAARARLTAVPHAPTVLAYTELRADDEGRLWVLPYWPPWEEGPPRPWEVFDSTGRWLGPVALPEGLEVTDIRDGHVVGVERDELDVPYVRVYRLER